MDTPHPTLNLNPRQAHAVVSPSDRLVIVAGPGSGKTHTLACRIAYLLKQGVKPQSVLALTFTRRAGRELAERIATMHPKGEEVTAKTFHAVAARLLRQTPAGFGLQPGFSILDDDDAHELFSRAVKRLLPEGSARLQTGDIWRRLSYCRNTLTPLDQGLRDRVPLFVLRLTLAAYAAYTEEKRTLNAVDFDDLLEKWADRMKADTAWAASIRDRWVNVFVDEFQDTNPLQLCLLRAWKPTRLTVVGDPAQAIFGFRGSRSSVMQAVSRHEEAEVVALTTNYRSAAPLVAVVNQMVTCGAGPGLHLEPSEDQRQARAFLSARILPNVHAEAEAAVAWCRDYLADHPGHSAAILSRTVHGLSLCEPVCVRHGLRFRKFGGVGLSATSEVKDMLACARIAINPRDRLAWLRLVQMCSGIGKVKSEAIVTGAVPLPPQAAFLGTIAGKASEDTPAASFFASVLPSLRPLFREKYGEEAEARFRTITRLTDSLQGFVTTLGVFLDALTLDADGTGSHEAYPPLTLSTIHSAKGREWDAVWLLGAGAKQLPHPSAFAESGAALDEERNLVYVALSRARSALVVSYPALVSPNNHQGPSSLLPRLPWPVSRPASPPQRKRAMASAPAAS